MTSSSDGSPGTPSIFVVCTGQDDNIGDIVLRRKLLSAFRRHGRLHVHVGPASAGFRESLELSPADTVYDSPDAWRAAARAAARRSPIWYVDKPGEVRFTRKHLRSQLTALPLLLLVKRRKGRIFRLGLGERARLGRSAVAYRLIYRASDLVAWRDVQSRTDFGFGTVMPDWGFADRGPGSFGALPDSAGHADDTNTRRDVLAVSLRGDRAYPSQRWRDSVRTFASVASLKIVTVTQVARDRERNLALASDLEGEFFDWPAARSQRDQEIHLRALYRRAEMCISDRLHVLIVGMTEGAIPVCLVDGPDDKISRHLEAIGYRNCSQVIGDMDPEQIVPLLVRERSRRAEVIRHVQGAIQAISRIESQIEAFGASQRC